MRQVMPHRNNIGPRRTKCKRYFRMRWINGVRRPQSPCSAKGAEGARGPPDEEVFADKSRIYMTIPPIYHDDSG
jgi:hypothetical protein